MNSVHFLKSDLLTRKADHILRLSGLVAMSKFAVPGCCWQGYFIDLDGNTFGILKWMKRRNNGI